MCVFFKLTKCFHFVSAVFALPYIKMNVQETTRAPTARKISIHDLECSNVFTLKRVSQFQALPPVEICMIFIVFVCFADVF